MDRADQFRSTSLEHGVVLLNRVLVEEVDDVRFGDFSSGLVKEAAGDKNAGLQICTL